MHPIAARDAFTDWRADLARNFYDADPHLGSLIRHHGRSASIDALRDFGGESVALDELVRENNRDEHLPILRRWDGQGRRVEAVDFHPHTHRIGEVVWRSGILSRYSEPGREFETLSLLYLFAQHGEAGHACPLACTAGMIKILQSDAEHDHSAWLERLLDPDYATRFHAAQFLTEVQGGSDVGANAVVARQDLDGTWRIHGEKWFCSVIDARLFLLTARPEGERAGTAGLRAFVVPREVDGQVNGFSIRRLKYKLGTRTMASAEVDFAGALAVPVGDFRQTVEVVLNTSRLYNAICSAASLQRAAREAHEYARRRLAFGRPILDFHTLARIVARLRTEACAARSVTFALAALSDRIRLGEASETERGAFRMLVNLNKFWTSIHATLSIRDAIEVLGGNGAIEEFSVLPRLLRDSIVCEAWEGGHNVLCAQALKDSWKLGLHRPMFDWLDERAGGDVPELAAARARWDRLLALPPQQAEAHVRDVAEELRVAAQCAVLTDEARTPGSDPLLPLVIEHHRVTNARGWDPLDDAGLIERVSALVR